MSDASDRLQNARTGAGFKTASDAARYHGWNENTYRSHENGERGLKARVASKYAKAFKVDYSWLLLGEGEKNKTDVVFVIGYIQNFGRVKLRSDDESPNIAISVKLPVSVPTNTKCYVVETSYLNPRYRVGDVLLTFKSEIEIYGDNTHEGVLFSSKGNYLGAMMGSPTEGYIMGVGGKYLRDFVIEGFEPIELVVRRSRYQADPNLLPGDDEEGDG